jgi:hypothetical protein
MRIARSRRVDAHRREAAPLDVPADAAPPRSGGAGRSTRSPPQFARRCRAERGRLSAVCAMRDATDAVLDVDAGPGSSRPRGEAITAEQAKAGERSGVRLDLRPEQACRGADACPGHAAPSTRTARPPREFECCRSRRRRRDDQTRLLTTRPELVAGAPEMQPLEVVIAS